MVDTTAIILPWENISAETSVETFITALVPPTSGDHKAPSIMAIIIKVIITTTIINVIIITIITTVIINTITTTIIITLIQHGFRHA